MELQELVDRIQRWKERTSEPASDYAVVESSESAEALASEYNAEIETTESEPPPVEGNEVLDFDDMNGVSELRGDESGIVEVTESEEN